jgi:O-antigen/teichoic acid export membrane protein
MKSASTPILVRLASNTTWMLMERGIALVTAVGVGLYFVRYLGPEDFGVYSYALGLYGLFVTASRLGINALVVSETVQVGPKQSTILGSAFTLRMIASVLCIILLNVTARLLGDSTFSRQITLVFSAALLFVPFETITHWFEATVQMRPVAIARSVTTLLIAACRLTLIFMGFSLFWFVWLTPLEGLLTSVFFFIGYRSRGFSLSDWKPDPELMKKFVRDGVPLFLSALAAVTYMRIDLVMLGKMTSSIDVGIYSAAVRISEMFYFIPVILAGVLFPYLIKAQSRGDDFFRQAFQVMCDGVAWIAILIAIPVTVFAVPLVSVAYGKEYLPSADILVVHVWAGIFIFIETMRLRWLVVHKLTYFQLLTTALGAVTNVVLNLYLIPLYKGYGAAIATVISYAVAIVLSCFLYRQTWEIGGILVKSLVAPFRIPQTMRAYVVVKTAVDSGVPSNANVTGAV